jgi:hypothetical protein
MTLLRAVKYSLHRPLFRENGDNGNTGNIAAEGAQSGLLQQCNAHCASCYTHTIELSSITLDHTPSDCICAHF